MRRLLTFFGYPPYPFQHRSAGLGQHRDPDLLFRSAGQ